MMLRTLLGILILQCCISSCASFIAPSTARAVRYRSSLWGESEDGNETPQKKKRTTVDQLEPVSSEKSQDDFSSSKDDTPLKERKKIVVPRPVTKALLVLGNVWNFASICLGTFFACGIALNIFGYGYVFTPDGFRVETIEELRMENLSRRQEGLMLHSEHKPPSNLPS